MNSKDDISAIGFFVAHLPSIAKLQVIIAKLQSSIFVTLIFIIKLIKHNFNTFTQLSLLTQNNNQQ